MRRYGLVSSVADKPDRERGLTRPRYGLAERRSVGPPLSPLQPRSSERKPFTSCVNNRLGLSYTGVL